MEPSCQSGLETEGTKLSKIKNKSQIVLIVIEVIQAVVSSVFAFVAPLHPLSKRDLWSFGCICRYLYVLACKGDGVSVFLGFLLARSKVELQAKITNYNTEDCSSKSFTTLNGLSC